MLGLISCSGFSLAAAGRGYSLVAMEGFSLQWFLLLQSTGSIVVDHGWKQPRCPLADKWIRKLWHIYTMKYYLVIKKNALESVLMRWMKLEPIIQIEVNQEEKHQNSILMYIYGT